MTFVVVNVSHQISLSEQYIGSLGRFNRSPSYQRLKHQNEKYITNTSINIFNLKRYKTFITRVHYDIPMSTFPLLLLLLSSFVL